MGIPRLRFPSGAPSRSTLKLEEAFHVFLPAEELDQHLRRGMTAVDLGACPGGWTYQFVSRGIKVFAIDNGAIDPELMETGLVTHRREDAFHFKPSQLVDWLVCDVVEQPASIADLMLNWFLKGWTTRAIFNLKLPMKQRLKEVQQCLEHLKTGCDKAGLSVSIACKQLYHDRKEVTVYMSLKA